MNSTFVFYALVAAIFATSICNLCEAYPTHCIPCLNGFENDCNDPPLEICEWGEIRDRCGRRVCGKGPGERCGGHLGICGEGMVCTTSFADENFERCHGCTVYRNMPCYPSLK